uniref:Uncharacterized protein n=1 Tax=Meloidogyne enterolobii TaxID=390850 RepID=A0A6V7XC37_MELEN|nr:unnamed protein product [Meloidogyne enterolobii]
MYYFSLKWLYLTNLLYNPLGFVIRFYCNMLIKSEFLMLKLKLRITKIYTYLNLIVKL